MWTKTELSCALEAAEKVNKRLGADKKRLKVEVKRLRKALEETECTCIGPQPSVNEGTMCVRCAALEE